MGLGGPRAEGLEVCDVSRKGTLDHNSEAASGSSLRVASLGSGAELRRTHRVCSGSKLKSKVALAEEAARRGVASM